MVGARIDLRDRSGQKFFDEEIRRVDIVTYALNAGNKGRYDFKMRGWPSMQAKEMSEEVYTYRGMPFQGKIASARDIGNYAAGYVAGAHGLSWISTRLAFDAYHSYKHGRLEAEPAVSQAAQWEGYKVGWSEYEVRYYQRLEEEATRLWPYGPKW